MGRVGEGAVDEVGLPALAAPLAGFLQAVMSGASNTTIAAAAAALNAAYIAAGPTTPNLSTLLPPALMSFASLATMSTLPPSFSASLGGAMSAVVAPLLTALNLTGTVNVTTTVLASTIRAGGVSVAPAPPAEEGGGSGALGALVLIPIAGALAYYFLVHRKKAAAKAGANAKAAAKADALDSDAKGAAGAQSAASPDAPVVVTATERIGDDDENGKKKKKKAADGAPAGERATFTPTGVTPADSSDGAAFSQANPMAAKANLQLRKTTVDVSTAKSAGKADGNAAPAAPAAPSAAPEAPASAAPPPPSASSAAPSAPLPMSART